MKDLSSVSNSLQQSASLLNEEIKKYKI